MEINIRICHINIHNDEYHGVRDYYFIRFIHSKIVLVRKEGTTA